MDSLLPDAPGAAALDPSIPEAAVHLLDGLNPSQVEAVTTATSPLCILAGAGSGKTRVLTRRIAYRALTGDLDPRRVLALTFTRKAAGELTSRLRALGLRESVAAGTFHAVAYAQLRSRWAERDITPPVLMTRKAGFVAQLLSSSERSTPAIDFVGEIEWAKARMIDPDRYAEVAAAAGRRPPISFEVTASVYERYEHDRRARRMIDFDDMLRVCLRDLEADEAFATSQRWRFAHLFVDEFQDVNPLQHALLEAWRGGRPDLCVVGDPNQAIYSWNGADPSLLLQFGRRHPGGATVRLTDNYRSTPQVLAAANSLLVGGAGVDHDGTQTATRPPGPIPTVREFPDERAEARGIARAVRDNHAPGQPWSSQAVLVRTNAQLAVIEEAMSQVSIPFRVRGAAPLLEQPEIRAALADLRRSARPFADALHDLALSVAAGDDTDTESDRAAERRANVDALVQLGRDYMAIEDPPSASGFHLWLSATTRADRPDPNADAVELLTFHAAKGLEWPIVHLAGLEQGYVPINHAKTPEAWQEERRLFYVAATRAEREVWCSWPAQRTFGERPVSRNRSEFLDTYVEACEALAAGVDPAEVGRGAKAPNHRPPEVAPRRGSSGGRSSSTRRTQGRYPEGLDTADRDLFDALRAWRSDRAKQADMPAFVVCNDATLAEIAERRPRTSRELLAVSGMGEIKVSRFGAEIIAVVAEHS